MSAPVIIKDVKVITTQPYLEMRLIVVKIITSEPGLYGYGCATFSHRMHPVVTAIEKHIRPFVLGKDVSRIEELWQMNMVNGYWRNGPVLNNAVSGIDQALWDIKGKMAGMPVYQLLGGKCREGAAVYGSTEGFTAREIADKVLAYMEKGYKYLRIQLGDYGGISTRIDRPEGSPSGNYYNARDYARAIPKMVEEVRKIVGEEVELCHDVHERLSPIDAVQLAKNLEPYNLFFLEDALAPEDLEWFGRIRQQCSTPLAMGELFNNPHEWRQVIVNRWVDFIRMHVSQMGGVTPARNVAAFAHMFGIRTAWHGSPDVSPFGFAANLHLSLWAPNFGIQEWCHYPEQVYEIFPGTPEVRNGYMYPNDKPGWGIELNEKEAAKYPCTDWVYHWTQARLVDGTPARP